MEDRIPTKPGRVALRDVDTGITKLYDMQMADEPTVEGTSLNKANLLTDATAAAILAEFGVTPDTPNEALAAVTAGSGKIELQSYAGTGTYGTSNPTSLTFVHEPKLVIIYGNTDGLNRQGADAYDTAILDWSRVKTGSNFRLMAPANFNYANAYTLSNGNKTITWYNTGAARQQLNENNSTYSVISFY